MLKHTSRLLLLASLGLLTLSVGSLRAGGRETATLEAAEAVLDALSDLTFKEISPALLRDAHGVAIIPNVIKAGFVLGGRYGCGVVLAREPNGSWSKPVFVTMAGGSIGWQVGVQSTDVVLVFKTRNSLERILKGKGKLTLGADVAVAAGPIGRQAEAGTDAQLKAEIFSYSRSRGLFVGLSLEGAVLHMDASATNAYYQSEKNAIVDYRTGALIPVTPPSERLRWKLSVATGHAGPPVILEPPQPAPQPGAEPPVAPPELPPPQLRPN